MVERMEFGAKDCPRLLDLNEMSSVVDQPIVPSSAAVEYAKQLTRKLARQSGEQTRVTIQKVGSNETLELPREVFDMLLNLLEIMSEGKPFSLIPMDEEFTTQQAADFLNVSRPYLIKILELGEIGHRKVGKNRRIQFRDLLNYKKEQEIKMRSALDQLTQQAQELDMGY